MLDSLKVNVASMIAVAVVVVADSVVVAIVSSLMVVAERIYLNIINYLHVN